MKFIRTMNGVGQRASTDALAKQADQRRFISKMNVQMCDRLLVHPASQQHRL
jgi:hypothetical protein